MKEILKKFTSRKFLMCLSGVVVGVITIYNGDLVNGGVMSCVSALTYIIIEGLIDKESLINSIDTAIDVSSPIASLTKSQYDDLVIEILEHVKSELESEDE